MCLLLTILYIIAVWDSVEKHLEYCHFISVADEIWWDLLGFKKIIKKSSYKSAQLHTKVLLNLDTLLICKLTESVGSSALSGTRDKQIAVNTEETARNHLPQVPTVVDRRSISTFKGEDAVEHLQEAYLLGCYRSSYRIAALIKS